MTFGDSLLQALGTGLCERSVPPIHSRRSRLCGPAAHSRALVRSLRNSGKCLRNCFLLTDWIFPRAFRQKGHSVYLSLFSGSRTVVQRVPQKLWEVPIVSCPQSVCGGITLIVPLSSGTKKNRNSRCARFDCPGEPVGLQWPNPNYREYMGDKSRKEVHKKALQKRIKDDAAVHEKQAMTEDQHHPTSGHTATPGHPTTSDERDPPRPQTDQPSGKNERRMDRPK
jgi:hypothetical protein